MFLRSSKFFHLCNLSSLNQLSANKAKVHQTISLAKENDSVHKFRCVAEIDDTDFFGIKGNPENERIKTNQNKLSERDKNYMKELVEKYQTKPKSKNIVEKSFGSIRYDLIPSPATARNSKTVASADLPGSEDNIIPENEGNQNFDSAKIRDRTLTKDLCSTESSVEKFSFIDEQYFCGNVHEGKQIVGHDAYPERDMASSYDNQLSKCGRNWNAEEMGYIDQQYFNEVGVTLDTTGQKSGPFQTFKNVEESTETFSKHFHKENQLSFVDEQYFIANNETDSHSAAVKGTHHSDNESEIKQIEEKQFTQTKHTDLPVAEEKQRKLNRNVVSPENKTIKELRKQTVYDISLKIRKNQEENTRINISGKFDPKEFDSTGHRILRNQVPHFDNVASVDVIKVLRKSIIYDQNDILAISKPYGLPSHDGPGVVHSVGALLDQIIPKCQLYPVHRLDKDTTGVMLLARTEEMANRLSECFLKREITKRYLVITKNIPQMMSGEIDIPVAEGTVQGKNRICLRPYKSPELSGFLKGGQKGTEAITRYKVLDMGVKCALLECIPITGKKQQIRVHLAFGLNCPVLGDHKFAHLNKLAPMRLHPEILKLLKIQQSKVRHLAMHLHARSVMIPEFFGGRNLFISAPLPPHFVRNMKDLKLKLPPHA